MEYEGEGDTIFSWHTWDNPWKNKGQVETVHTTVLLRSARILRRVQDTWGDFLSLKLSVNASYEKLSKV